MTIEQSGTDKKQGRTVTGKVTSARMNSTIVVRVERRVKHPVYRKYVRRFSTMYAHDAANRASEGDIVLIKSCRPISKLKHWELLEVVSGRGADSQS